MKKIIAFLLAAVMVLATGVVGVSAASAIDHKLTVNGSSDVEVKTGDVITVTYTMYGSGDKIQTSQDEIYYDHMFFELVEDSITASAQNFNTSEQVKSTGRHYIYFNTMQSRTVSSSGLTVGTFKLKVLGTTGYSVIKNTSCFAMGTDASTFGGTLTDLTVRIESTPQIASYPIIYSASAGGKVTGTSPSGTAIEEGKTITLTATPDSGYKFSCWSDGTTVNPYVITATKELSLIASFEKSSSGNSVSTPGSKVSETEETTGTDYASCGKGGSCPLSAFTDVKATDWYHDGVHYCIDNGLMNGTSATTFAPNTTMTRAMIVTVLYRLENQPAVSGTSGFTDVSASGWYGNAVAWASANGIVGGYGDGKFGPNDSITREQMAAILYRYAAYKNASTSESGSLSGFSDSGSVSSYANTAMQWAVGCGLINGSDGKLLPGGYATRAQVATIFQRYCTR